MASFIKKTSQLITQGKLNWKKIEKAHIQDVLRYTAGNIKSAAEHLGTSRGTLYRKIKKYSLKMPREKRTGDDW